MPLLRQGYGLHHTGAVMTGSLCLHVEACHAGFGVLKQPRSGAGMIVHGSRSLRAKHTSSLLLLVTRTAYHTLLFEDLVNRWHRKPLDAHTSAQCSSCGRVFRGSQTDARLMMSQHRIQLHIKGQHVPGSDRGS